MKLLHQPLPTIVFLLFIIPLHYGSDDDPVKSSCFTSIFSFDDSATATGIQIQDFPPGTIPHHCALPPYGETFFHRPTGRCSDGRLIVDFIAHHLGLPLLPPYHGDPTSYNNITSFLSQGANFAVDSATALDHDFLEARGISTTCQNCSLSVQLDRFKILLTNSLCFTPSECRDYLRNSLFLVGEIGGVDYQRAALAGLPSDQIEDLIPIVMSRIGSAIEELIELGAVNFLVPGDFPKGCFPIFLTLFQSSNQSDYDPVTGCLVYYNWFSDHHNRMLRGEIERVRKLHPGVRIHYADYFGPSIRMRENPEKFGLERATINRACCGAGGPYNYVSSAICGRQGAVACESPSSYINWDDHHYTEAANRVIAGDVMKRRRFNGLGCRPNLPARELPMAAE